MQNDDIIQSFIENYGIISLLEDINVKKLQKTNINQIIACCPLHEDENPSFSMNLETGLFTCFGCDQHGNLRTFISQIFHLNSKETQKFLLHHSGLENVNIQSLKFKNNIEKILQLKEPKEDFIFPIIQEKTIKRMYQGVDPHQYLLKRGFSQSTIDYFQCGYTKDYFGSGYNNQERITIPGHDEYGNICGFIGRTPIDATPKYLYTPGYPKSHTMFNLHRAKEFDSLILVEGSLDVMMLHELDKPNACAILGASLSHEQLQLCLKYTDTLYLMFDNDKAGRNANKIALEMTKNIINVFHVPLGDLKDPGEIPDKKTLNHIFSNSKNWNNYMVQKKIFKHFS